MKAPKTIYVDVHGFGGELLSKRTAPYEKEYRLVGQCVWNWISGDHCYITQCGREPQTNHGDYCSCGDKIRVVS